MIARAEGVGIGVQKYGNAGLLVILQEVPANRRQDDADGGDIAQQGQLDARYKYHSQADGQKDEARPQVGLLQYEQEGDADE